MAIVGARCRMRHVAGMFMVLARRACLDDSERFIRPGASTPSAAMCDVLLAPIL